MRYASALVRLMAILIIAAAAVAGACSGSKTSDTASAAAAAGGAGEKYPAPRWPSYFKPPSSVEDLMPAARALVRNQSGLQGKGMGILAPG